jgi:ubiquinone/menaquinone biosynthesis C-methylase UbiE
LQLLSEAGFKDNNYENMFNGIVSLHRGRKWP